MSDWRTRGKKFGDVVHFPYVTENTSKKAKSIFLWDVDKTYLDTKFESLKGLWRTATEKATSKNNVPGTGELTRCLNDKFKNEFAIFFVTASPPQIEHKIFQKLKHDGLEPYGIFCRDNFQNLRPRKLWRITKHVGYKLQALLQLRAHLAEDVKITMFGDDGESDAIIYSLFSDICGRRIDSSEIRSLLNSLKVMDHQVDVILDLQSQISKIDPVEKVYINLAADTDADYYVKYGLRTLPTYNAFQTSLDLYQDKKLDIEHIIKVADRLVSKYEYSPEELELSFDDLIRRNRLSLETYEQLSQPLTDARILSRSYKSTVPPKQTMEHMDGVVTKMEGWFEPWVPDHIDYLHDYR